MNEKISRALTSIARERRKLRPGSQAKTLKLFRLELELNDLLRREGLPPYSYSTLPVTGEIIVIYRGAGGYPHQTKSTAQELNEALGVTKAQAEAMMVGYIFGWDMADPADYDTEGRPLRIRA